MYTKTKEFHFLKNGMMQERIKQSNTGIRMRTGNLRLETKPQNASEFEKNIHNHILQNSPRRGITFVRPLLSYCMKIVVNDLVYWIL